MTLTTQTAKELVEAAKECAATLESYVAEQYVSKMHDPVQRTLYERDIAPVTDLRTAIKEMEGA